MWSWKWPIKGQEWNRWSPPTHLIGFGALMPVAVDRVLDLACPLWPQS
jgi:hypothetical protein